MNVLGSFAINQKLCSLNEYINACRGNKYLAAKFKRDIEDAIGWHIKAAVAKRELKPIKTPVIVRLEFYEKTKRRDVDGIISGGSKVILDALVKYGILQDDGRKYVKQVHSDVYDADKDYVKVFLLDASK